MQMLQLLWTLQFMRYYSFCYLAVEFCCNHYGTCAASRVHLWGEISLVDNLLPWSRVQLLFYNIVWYFYISWIFHLVKHIFQINEIYALLKTSAFVGWFRSCCDDQRIVRDTNTACSPRWWWRYRVLRIWSVYLLFTLSKPFTVY